jgi:hypothetical protein
VFLDRYEATREIRRAHRSVLEEIPRSAAFLADGGPGSPAATAPAQVAFGIAEPAVPFADLPFDAEDIAPCCGRDPQGSPAGGRKRW